MPAHVTPQPGNGTFLIQQIPAPEFRGAGVADARVKRAGERFLANLGRRTNLASTAGGQAAPSFVITCNNEGEKVQTLGEDESYRLEVTPTEVHLDAPTPLGVIHGLQTFLQLTQKGPDGFYAPAVVIEDAPRFPWRGILIDVSRHFMPVETVKRNLDAMEAVKLNVLHWHLSDDQGFRVESKKLPKLQQLASDGMYYTQEQIKDVIAYARERGIRVVPEFDVPGHTTSWFAAYPEVASAPGPYEVWRRFGVNDAAMDPTRDHTYHVLDDFFGEMSRLFPDQYLHIGGDEVNGKQWEANRKIREFKRKHHLKNGHDLQAYFNQRLQKIVNSHGKIMMGWDEILHADLPKDVVIQSWRGQQSLADAARQGYRGLLSYGYYLDLMQPASQHYAIDPLANGAANLSAEEKRRILGGEACMWAEFVTPDNIDERIWPRAIAVAERLWSPPEVVDVESMYRRLQGASTSLEASGIKHEAQYSTMLGSLAGGGDVEALRTLADLLEPVKGYARPRARHYETTTPLNRLVDAVRPESDAGREFARSVERILNKSAGPVEIARMRSQLVNWQENDRRLQPLLQSRPLLQETMAISQNLAIVADAALRALDSLDAGGKAPAAWRDQQLAFLKEAQKPQAEMLDTLVPSVQKLVEATVAE
jgi:hexosaminidase